MAARTLVIGKCGPDFARRYFLADQDANYWGGRGWTRDPNARWLWATPHEAARKLYELMLTEVPGALHIFAAPVTIFVKTIEPVDAKALESWLSVAFQGVLDASHGTGPGNSMVMLQFAWDEIEPIE